jgi:hypothetical protein
MDYSTGLSQSCSRARAEPQLHRPPILAGYLRRRPCLRRNKNNWPKYPLRLLRLLSLVASRRFKTSATLSAELYVNCTNRPIGYRTMYWSADAWHSSRPRRLSATTGGATSRSHLQPQRRSHFLVSPRCFSQRYVMISDAGTNRHRRNVRSHHVAWINSESVRMQAANS